MAVKVHGGVGDPNAWQNGANELGGIFKNFFGGVSAWQRGARQFRGIVDNALGSVPALNNGLRQQQQMSPGIAHGAEQIGSFFTGTPERTLQKPFGGPGASNGLARPKATPRPLPAAQPNPQPVQQAEPNYGYQVPTAPDILSFLGQAMDTLRQNGGLQSGTNYDELKNQLRGQYTENDARLAAMYNQLRTSYANDAPGIAQAYDNASSSVGQASDQAQQSTDAAYQAARNAQTQQLAALGIGDAAAVNASNGSLAANDQASHDAAIQQNKALVQNNLTEHKAAAGNYNTNIEHAAGLEGALQRATLQQQLAAKLADIGVKQSSEGAQIGAQNFQNALSLAGQLQQQAQGNQNATLQEQQYEASQRSAAEKFAYQQYLDDQKLQQQQQSQGTANQLKQQGMLAVLYPALLKQYGGDDTKARAAAKALGLLG